VRLAALYRGDAGDAGDPGDAGDVRLHVAVDGGFAPVDDLAAGARRPDLAGLRDAGDLYARGTDAVERLRDLAVAATPSVAADGARYAPPVLRPGKIICVGLNYADHIAESRTAKPDRIVLFAKFSSCLIGHGDPIRYPAITTELDYEGELAVVIGRRARNVPVDSALDYVGGYTVINDVSARDLQGTEPQWIRGKALDTFAPLGPVLLDAAAAPPVAEMRLRTLVNGEVRQDASCARMITGVPELIAYISNGITLEPGDIIATGTPSGVAMGMNPPKWLQPGDKVSIEITAIGELVNAVAAAS
jgi:acylpyruvate hydrolase